MIKQNKLSKIIEWGIYLLVFLLPWQARVIYKVGELAGGFWEYGTFAVYGTELLLLVLVVLNIIEKFRNKKEEIRKKKGGMTTIVKPCLPAGRLLNCSIVLLFVVTILTVFWAGDSGLGLYKFGMLLEGFLLFWLVVSSRVSFRRMAWILVLSGVVQAGLGIWQFLGQEILGNKWLGMATQFPMDGGVSVVETSLRRWLRAYGTLPHPNILGGWLVVGLLMTLGLYEFEYKKERPSILKIVILLYCW